MDNIFDRLGDLLRGLFSETGESGTGSAGPSTARRSRDPDLEEAWKELDEYLRTGRDAPRASGPGARTRPAPDESLRQDYANLEVPFGAEMEEVKRSYKSLVLRYHPDRFASDAEKQRVALEITKKINQSFERIRGRG